MSTAWLPTENRPRRDSETESATWAEEEGLVVWLGLSCRPGTLPEEDSLLGRRNPSFWPIFRTYLALLD